MSNYKTTNCDCKNCSDMCKHFPCKGTFQEIKKIIEAGFENDLQTYTYRHDFLGKVRMLLPMSKETLFSSICVFLTEDNHCRLHELDLKPIEGKFADCKHGLENGLTTVEYWEKYEELKLEILKSWTTEEAQSFVSNWLSQKINS